MLGALAGALATTGAALVAGWASREQARISARVEYRKLLAEPRREAYRRFVEAATAYLEHLEKLTATRRVDSAFVQEAMGLTRPVREAWASVALAGPDSASDCAGDFRKECARHAQSLSPYLGAGQPAERWREASAAYPELWSQLDAFIAQVQAALDDHGR